MPSEDGMDLLRYSVISTLLHHDDSRSLKKRMIELSQRVWTLPDGKTRQFCWGTIEDWYYRYRHGNITALANAGRSDKGSFREIDEPVMNYIDDYLRKHPGIKTSVMLTMMKKDATLKSVLPSNSTIYRYVRSIRPGRTAPVKERRSFEAPYSGNLWQTDILYGPYLPYKNDRGRWVKKQTFLVAVLDDHSRLLCHGEFFFRQDILAYLSCLKTALLKRGIPEKLYCDNGQVFLSGQVKRIMCRLGTTVIHTQIRDCAAKGKIERFFLTLRNRFLDPLMEFEKPGTLEELNRKFWQWAEEAYNHKVHSGINAVPIERWMASAHRVRLFNLGEESEVFYFTSTRKIKKDGTFSFKGRIFETDWSLSRKKVDITYDPFAPDRVFVSYEGLNYGRANLLDKNFNHLLPGRNKQED